MNHAPIREVWAHNLEQEFHLMLQIIEQEKYMYCSLDAEFPGVVLSAPEGVHMTKWERKWAEMRSNVDVLQLIQIGFALSDENGNPPPGCGCWQFNFKFDLTQDLHATDAIQLLQRAGCDFRRHRSDGVCPYRFGELLYASGLALNENIKWISFHGGYDFSYLAKALHGPELPGELDDMHELLALLFPRRCDIKWLLRDSYRGGLTDLARQTGCDVAGCHQAGLDAILTRDVFFALGLKDRAFDTGNSDCGALFGLGASRRKGWSPASPEMKREPQQRQSWDAAAQYAQYETQWCEQQYWGVDEWNQVPHDGSYGQWVDYGDDWSTGSDGSWASATTHPSMAQADYTGVFPPLMPVF